jgi:hypothetical protein
LVVKENNSGVVTAGCPVFLPSGANGLHVVQPGLSYNHLRLPRPYLSFSDFRTSDNKRSNRGNVYRPSHTPQFCAPLSLQLLPPVRNSVSFGACTRVRVYAYRVHPPHPTRLNLPYAAVLANPKGARLGDQRTATRGSRAHRNIDRSAAPTEEAGLFFVLSVFLCIDAVNVSFPSTNYLRCTASTRSPMT